MTSWYVVFTKPRQEARAQAQLEGQGFEVYGPRYRRIWAGSSVACVEPMFPRYLFLRPTRAEPSLAVISPTFGVNGLVRVGVEPAKVEDEVINGIRALEAEKRAAPKSSLYRYQAADRLRLTQGALASWEGLLESVAEQRVMALMNFLGRECRVGMPLARLSAY